MQPTNKKVLYGALGVGAAGAGAHYLADAVVKPHMFDAFKGQEAADRLAGTHAGENPSFANGFKALSDYANNGHALMGGSTLGINNKELIKGLRTYSPGLSDKDRWGGAGSDLHYDAFKQGPFNAFVRYFDEEFGSDRMKQDPGSLGQTFNGELPAADIRKEFKDSVNNYLAKQTGVQNYYDGTGYGDVPTASNPTQFDTTQQKALLDGYGKDLETNGSDRLKDLVKEHGTAPYRSYDRYKGGLVDKFEGMNKGLHLAGNTLIGAGAGGGVGALLGNYLTANKKNQSRNMWIGGGLGAALGGGAGYYLSQ